MKPVQTIGLAGVLVTILTWPLASVTTVEGASLIPDRHGAQTMQSADLAGTYKLVAIDGHDLPYAMMHDGQPGPTITAGSLTLNKDASVLSSMSIALPGGQAMTREMKGTYTRHGAALDATWDGAGHTTINIEDQILTMDNEGTLFRYKKQ